MGKVQPLLVCMKDADQAQTLINSAKSLRASADPIVRQQVYINAYLTKAEAEAAYYVRVQRRQAKQSRKSRGDDDANRNTTSTLINNQEAAALPQVAGQTSLNPHATTFTSSAAHSG
jgi:hypothetical protein